MPLLHNRTVPGGWSQPSQPATETVQHMVDKVKDEFEKLAKTKYKTFQATSFWDQITREKGKTNYCIKIDIGDSSYIYVELAELYEDPTSNSEIKLTSLLREWAWEDNVQKLDVVRE